MPWILKQVSVNSVMDAETVIQKHLKIVLHVFRLKFWTKLQWNVWVLTALPPVSNVHLMVNVQLVILGITWNNQAVYLVKFSIVNNVTNHHYLVIPVLKGIFSTALKSNVCLVQYLVNLVNPVISPNVLVVLEDIMKLLSTVRRDVPNVSVIVQLVQMVLHVQNAAKDTHFQAIQQSAQYPALLNVPLVMRLIQQSVWLVIQEPLSIH